jgi:thiol:disulfide interchange protein DsbC
MLKTLLIILTQVALLMTLNATEIIVDKVKLQELRSKNRVLQDPVLSIKGAIEKDDSYILKLVAKSPRGSENITAFLNKKTAELYIGAAYESTGKPITFPIDGQTVKNGVAFSYGKGSKELYIVTDPECPYCIRFEKAIAGKLSDYTVHVILMPLSFHKKAPAMIEWIMQGKDDTQRKERFEALMLKGSTVYQTLIKDAKKPFVYSGTVGEVMKKVENATMELKVRGTPAIYDASFNPIEQGQLLNAHAKGNSK